jgi:hypothetical protein
MRKTIGTRKKPIEARPGMLALAEELKYLPRLQQAFLLIKPEKIVITMICMLNAKLQFWRYSKTGLLNIPGVKKSVEKRQVDNSHLQRHALDAHVSGI